MLMGISRHQASSGVRTATAQAEECQVCRRETGRAPHKTMRGCFGVHERMRQPKAAACQEQHPSNELVVLKASTDGIPGKRRRSHQERDGGTRAPPPHRPVALGPARPQRVSVRCRPRSSSTHKHYVRYGMRSPMPPFLTGLFAVAPSPAHVTP